MKHRLLIAAFAYICALTTTIQAAELKHLYFQKGLSKPNKKAEIARSNIVINSSTLDNRRFVLRTSSGHIIVARKQNSRGKTTKISSNGKRYIAHSFNGTLRSRGHSNISTKFVLTVLQGNSSGHVVSGMFHDGDKSYSITTEGNKPIAQTFNTQKFPDCGGVKLGQAPDNTHITGADLPNGKYTAMDGSVQIDVAILLTPEYITAAGDETAAAAEAQTAITTTNQTYTDSQISASLNLVYVGTTTTSESGSFSTDLTRLYTSSDGYFDEAQSVREAYGADMVSLLVTESEYCGLAYLMTTVDYSFEDSAFSVVNRDCASANYSFPHELGHNMGANHDVANAGGAGAYSYSYGWRFTGNDATQYRTVMAYAPGTRIGYFSNPDVSYQGVATGDATNANNALTLNNTVSTIASFRTSTGAATPTPAPTATATPNVKLTKLTKTRIGSNCVAKGKVINATTKKAVAKQLVYLRKYIGSSSKHTKTSSKGLFTLTGKVNTLYYLQAGNSYSTVFKCKK